MLLKQQKGEKTVENIDIFMACGLFKDLSKEEIEQVIKCCGKNKKKVKKGCCVYRAGDHIKEMGLVLKGGLIIENDDIWGNKVIIDHVGPGQIFGETYACAQGEPLLVNVVAGEDTEILLINPENLFGGCSKPCPQHNKMMVNLLTMTAKKNINLSRKIMFTSSKTIRGRLSAYFSFQSMKNGSARFTIPFNRQQLADYLGVDRSAMSHELSKMKEEGRLDYWKNSFLLIKANIGE